MASFVGTFDEFIKYISPRARNVVNSLSRKYKKEVGQCEKCHSKTATLEAAHIAGRERLKIIKDILETFTNGEIITIDLEVFESKFLKEHEPIENNIRVLCRPCHRDYDSLSDGIIEYPFKTNTAISESNSSIEIPSISNSEITTFLRQIVPKLSGDDVEKLLDAECCKNIFRVNFPVLKSIPFESDKEMISKLARINGYIRWSPQRTIERSNSRYLVLTQWYDRNRSLFIKWKQGIEDAYKV